MSMLKAASSVTYKVRSLSIDVEHKLGTCMHEPSLASLPTSTVRARTAEVEEVGLARC